MSDTVAKAIEQAKAIQARPDYDTLPKDVRDWCERILSDLNNATFPAKAGPFGYGA